MKKILMLLLASISVGFTANAQSCEVEDIWLEHNVYQSGYKGMKIHSEFTVDDCEGKTIQCCAYFFNEDGYPIAAPYGAPSYCKTRDGQLCTGTNSYVKYESSYWDDFVLFIPNGMFAPGSYQCIVQISLLDGTILGLSDTEYFSVSR